MNYRHRPMRAARRRGFASFTAVVLVGTTAIVLAAVASQTIRQAKATRDAATDAQLRQLLHTGEVYVKTAPRPAMVDGQGMTPSLPEGLGEDAALTIRPIKTDTSGQLTVMVSASLHGRAAEQSLTLDRDAARWRVRSVQLP